MKKNNIEIHNLGKKIYILCYVRPCYKSKISEMIYGDSNKKGIYQEIKKLEKNNWIKKADNKIITKLDLSGRNAKKRQYYISLYFPLKNAIVDKLKQNNITFNNEELIELEKILDHDIIKDIIEITIKSNDLSKNIDLFDKILDSLNFFGSLSMVIVAKKLIKFKEKTSFNFITPKELNILSKFSKINKEFSDIMIKYIFDINYLIDKYE